jgi:hypothetical protein
MKRYLTWLCLVIVSGGTICAPSANGQAKTSHDQQVWVGYMTSSRVSENYSLWNDVHIVPEAFAIIRTGVTRSVMNNAGITTGYAFLLLPAGAENKLQRHEHRPWAQFQVSLPSGSRWTMTQRVRYDARFKQRVKDGEVTEGYGFNHRVRFLFSLRRNLGPSVENRAQPYVVASNEVLLNFGKEITYNTFDQNRLSISFGLQKNQTQYQVGFMNRFVQTGPSRYTLNYTFVVWVIQKFDLRKIFQKQQHQDIISE